MNDNERLIAALEMLEYIYDCHYDLPYEVVEEIEVIIGKADEPEES